MKNPDSAATRETVVIAIDGPAASGKSTVAKELARQLGFHFLNSGDLYRAMTWSCLCQGVDCRDAGAVAAVAGQSEITLRQEGGHYFVLIDGRDPRKHLRDAAVNENVSPVSTVPAVRYILSAAIRRQAQGRRTVIEGRDIGSAVFPESPFKFYIDASPQVRQRRRRNQGQTEDVSRRDLIDSTRRTDPLMVAPGATVIDTSALDVAGVVGAMMEKLRTQGLVGVEA